MEETKPILEDAHMSDLPIESPYADILMSIDSARFTEDVVTLLTFLAILLIALFSGFFGPKPSTTEYAIEPFDKFTATVQPKFAYSVINLSSLTKVLEVSLIMERKPGIEPVKGGCSILVEGSRKGTIGRLYSQSYQPLPVDFKISGNSSVSQTIKIFSDKTVDYNYVSVQLSFTSVIEEYSAAKVLFRIGNAEFVVYEMIFRLLFSSSMIAFLVLLLLRLKSTKPKDWHLEQKITVPLLFLLAIFNDPLYGTRIVSWATIYMIDAISKAVIVGFLIYFILVLFDGLSYKNGISGVWFFFPKILVSVFVGIVLLLYGLLDNFLNLEEQKAGSSIAAHLETVKLLILPSMVVTLFYISVVIALAFKNVDPTEKYKLNLYVLSVAICFLAGLVGYHVKEDNALIFTIQYAIVSLFGILMAYFHWPYEVGKDQTYDEQDHAAFENQDGASFFANDDSEH